MGSSLTNQVLAEDGTPINFSMIGTGPARIVLCHSLAMDHRFWLPVARRLGDEASVLVWDCRGHGASGKPKGPYTVELFADDLAAVMDAVNWPSAIIGGASMGGCVTLAFAGRHRRRVQGLGLFDTTAWYGADAPQAWSQRAEKAIANGLPALIDFQLSRWFTDAFRQAQPQTVEECVSIFLANDVAAYAESCRMLGRADLRDVLPTIGVPVEIVVGEEDYATPPSMARVLEEQIAGARLEIIEGGRHLTPLEHPDRIAAHLRRLIERRAS
ncbi:MAG: alpha/beta hydrolase [Pseudaminobacter sp.]